MRILHLSTVVSGRAGRMLVDLIRHQVAGGDDVTVMTASMTAEGGPSDGQVLEAIRQHGAHVRIVDALGATDRAGLVTAAGAICSRYGAGSEPHVIHTHSTHASFVALLFAGTRRQPIGLVQTMHGWGVIRAADQVATDAGVINFLDRVAVPSRQSADTLASLGVAASRVVLVPYGVDAGSPEMDARAEETLRVMSRARRNGTFVVACTGALANRKNQQIIVEAIALTRHSVPMLCVCLGDGDASGLRDSVEALGLGEQTRIHGASHASRRIAAHADLVVVPARADGQALAVLEAFCDRVIVAVGDTPELAELVEDGVTGFRFDANDAAALAATLSKVAEMAAAPRRTMQNRAHAVYAARYTASTMAERYQALYLNLRRSGAPDPRNVAAS